MAQRIAHVEVTTTIEVIFDDEATGDWDGRTVLTRHENPEVWLPGSTPRDVLAGAAVTIGLWNSRDGWADFSRDAITAREVGDRPEIGTVRLDGKVIQ